MIRPRRGIEDLPSERPPLDAGTSRMDSLRLDLNESSVGSDLAVVQRLKRALNARWLACYPEYEAGRAVLARHFGVTPEELILTNGIDDAIRLICSTFVEPRDRLVIPTPTFPMYAFFHQLAGGRVLAVECDSNHRVPLQRILRATHGARWLALANPNNPTGALLAKKSVRAILESAPRTLVLVDEAYFDFSGSTVLSWIGHFPNLVVARTFSKAYGLAGLRLGLLFANPRLAGMMRRAHAVFPVNSLALAGALEAVRHPGHVERYARMVTRNRAWLRRQLLALGARCAPSAANFVFARLGPQAPEIARRLRADGILVRDWSDELRPYLRITVGTNREMRRLAKALEGLRDLIDPDNQSTYRRGTRLPMEHNTS